jgi:hypothetical protein
LQELYNEGEQSRTASENAAHVTYTTPHHSHFTPSTGRLFPEPTRKILFFKSAIPRRGLESTIFYDGLKIQRMPASLGDGRSRIQKTRLCRWPKWLIDLNKKPFERWRLNQCTKCKWHWTVKKTCRVTADVQANLNKFCNPENKNFPRAKGKPDVLHDPAIGAACCIF